MLTTNDQETFTPEQAAQNLRTAQEDKVRADQDFVEAEAKLQREAAERRELNSTEAFKEAVRATGIKFHFLDLNELKVVLGSKFDVATSNDGTFFKVTDADGRVLTIEKSLEELATKFPYLVRSGAEHLRVRAPETGKYTDLVRDDFTSFAARSRWIEEHSLAEFEALAQHRTPTVTAALMTRSQYNHLSRAEKSRLLNEVGESGLTTILARNY